MALLGAGKSVAAGRRRRRRRAARAAGALVARRRRPAEARPGVCNLGRGATGGDRCLASGVRAGARGARGGTALAGGGLSASDLEPGASPRRSRTGCPGRARSRRRLWRPWIRPAGRRAALAAEAPRRLGRRERRLAWVEVEGRPCDGNRPPLFGSGMGDVASLPDSFHAPSPPLIGRSPESAVPLPT